MIKLVLFNYLKNLLKFIKHFWTGAKNYRESWLYKDLQRCYPYPFVVPWVAFQWFSVINFSSKNYHGRIDCFMDYTCIWAFFVHKASKFYLYFMLFTKLITELYSHVQKHHHYQHCHQELTKKGTIYLSYETCNLCMINSLPHLIVI